MTDRIKALTVVLDDDYREDDIESLISAIKQLKGVGEVKNIIANSNDIMARQRVKLDLQKAFLEFWEKAFK